MSRNFLLGINLEIPLKILLKLADPLKNVQEFLKKLFQTPPEILKIPLWLQEYDVLDILLDVFFFY